MARKRQFKVVFGFTIPEGEDPIAYLTECFGSGLFPKYCYADLNTIVVANNLSVSSLESAK